MFTASPPNQLLIFTFLLSLLIAHEFEMRQKQGSSEAILEAINKQQAFGCH